MNTKYTLKNFRVFDEQGATFEMAPITILTGCNSSGKSSVTKSLMLLKPLLHNIKEDIRQGLFGGFSGKGFNSYDLDFTKGQHKLGTLEKVINWNSEKKEFSITYSIPSYALNRWMDVCIVFEEKDDTSVIFSLHSRIKMVEISSEGKTFFRYDFVSAEDNKPDSTVIGSSYICLSDWKNELTDGLITLENGYLLHRIREDEKASEAGVPGTMFWEGDMMSAISFFGENSAAGLHYIYRMMEAKLPLQMKAICSKFDLKNNIVRKMEAPHVIGDIDWENSMYTFDFPYGHLLPLNKLMDDLNSIEKEKIVEYALKRFVDEKQNEWYNTQSYQYWIRSIFEEYSHSSFEKFSDFYSFYENAYLEKEFVYFGTQNSGRTRVRTEGHYGLKLGTGCPQPLYEFEDESSDWENLTANQKFYKIFWCLQGEGGYENLSSMMGPEMSFPQLDIIREFATLVCFEVLVSCDLLSEPEFIVIDRANTQRLYSFSEQGTEFNSLLDDYYNLSKEFECSADYFRYEFSNKRFGTYTKGTFVNKWLRELTGFMGFDIKLADEGVGYYVSLLKESPSGDIKNIALADLGFGVTPLISMLLRIELIICRSMRRLETITICIEEPESNLHPDLQSQLAEMFADAVKCSGGQIHFILETHSEYLVRRTQVLVAEEQYENEQALAEKCPFKVYYLPRLDEGKPYDMVYQTNGRFMETFGPGFFDVASDLALDIF